MKRLWDGSNLKTLIEKSGGSIQRVADYCGVSNSAIVHWTENSSAPSFDKLIAIADFFAVPLDFLCGRCDEETANDILKDYEHTYEKIRRSEYETIMARRGECFAIPAGYLAPWPYNLIDDIFQEPWDHVVTPDEEDGLMKAINTLYDRERECLLAYYQEGLDLSAIGKRFNVSRERIRQVIAKAVRKLRYPARSRYIRYGEEGTSLIEEYKEKLRELKQREEALEAREEYVNTYLKPKTETIEKCDGSVAETLSDEPKYEKFPWGGISRQPSEAFLFLDLSVRSFNCLCRADCITVADIVRRIRLGDLTGFRNMGRKSVNEVIQKTSKAVGYDCYDIWGVDAEDKKKVIPVKDLKEGA